MGRRKAEVREAEGAAGQQEGAAGEAAGEVLQLVASRQWRMQSQAAMAQLQLRAVWTAVAISGYRAAAMTSRLVAIAKPPNLKAVF